MEVDSQFDEMNATITYLQAENEALKSKLGELESKFNQGFSVEGIFNYKKGKQPMSVEESLWSEICSILEQV